MSWRILFIIFALFLVIGAGCQSSDTVEEKEQEQSEKQDTKSSNNQYYDNLDDALKELDGLEQTGN